MPRTWPPSWKGMACASPMAAPTPTCCWWTARASAPTDGASPDGKKGTPLMGDIAARILDLAGIVLNRNTIPGDRSARNPSGIRLGTPWITQRGFERPEIERLAEIIARVAQGHAALRLCRAAMARSTGPRSTLTCWKQAKWDVVDLACCADLAAGLCPSGYPHHYFMHKPTTDPGGEWDIIEIEGPHARGFCNVAMTNDVYALEPGESQPTWILEPDGRPMSGGVLKRPGKETTRFQLLIPKSVESRVAHWLRALSDGYVHMDVDDLFAKAPGPVVVRRLPHELADEWEDRPPADRGPLMTKTVGWAFHKPYWIGQRARADAPGGLEPLPPFAWEEPAGCRPCSRPPCTTSTARLGPRSSPLPAGRCPSAIARSRRSTWPCARLPGCLMSATWGSSNSAATTCTSF